VDWCSKSHHCWKTCSLAANTPHNPTQRKTSLKMFDSLFVFSWMLFSLMQSKSGEDSAEGEKHQCNACRGSGGSWEVRSPALMDSRPLGGMRTLMAIWDPGSRTRLHSHLVSLAFPSHRYPKQEFWLQPLSYVQWSSSKLYIVCINSFIYWEKSMHWSCWVMVYQLAWLVLLCASYLPLEITQICRFVCTYIAPACPGS